MHWFIGFSKILTFKEYYLFSVFVPLHKQWSKALWLANMIAKKVLLFLASKKALYDAENILITL